LIAPGEIEDVTVQEGDFNADRGDFFDGNTGEVNPVVLDRFDFG
jgi:hypothetical protein